MLRGTSFPLLLCRSQQQQRSTSKTAPLVAQTHFSSFFYRLLDCTDAFLFAEPGPYADRQQRALHHRAVAASLPHQIARGRLDHWRQHAAAFDQVFARTSLRYHTVRVPVQRHIAKRRAASRARSSAGHTSTAENPSKETTPPHEPSYLEQVLGTPEEASARGGNGGGNNYRGGNNDGDDDLIVVDDAAQTIKAKAHERARSLQRQIDKSGLKLRREQQQAQAESSSSASRSVSKKGKTATTATGAKLAAIPLLRRLSPRAVSDAVRDMREERFAEFLRTVTERLRSATGSGVAADHLAGTMCRAWLDAQAGFGFSFPSTESVASPLLPAMLFLGAARDPELFLMLQRRIEESRTRFLQQAATGSKARFDGGGGGSADGGVAHDILSLTATSPLPGWIAATAIAMDEALLSIQREHRMQRKAKGGEGGENEEGGDADAGDDWTPTTNTLVERIAARLDPLIVNDRAFGVSARAAAQRVVPIVLSTLSTIIEPHSSALRSGRGGGGDQKRASSSLPRIRRAIRPSRVSYVTGTTHSPSSFQLWSLFARRICGICSSRAFCSGGGTMLPPPPVAAVPAYFSSFLLSVAQTQAHFSLYRDPNTNSGSAAAAASSPRSASASAGHMVPMDTVVEFAVGAAVAHLALAARLLPASAAAHQPVLREVGDLKGSGAAAFAAAPDIHTEPHFAVYVKLLNTLAACGCAAWVVESVLRDALVIVGKTDPMTGHVVGVHEATALLLLHTAADSLVQNMKRTAPTAAARTANAASSPSAFLAAESDDKLTSGGEREAGATALAHRRGRWLLLPQNGGEEPSPLLPVDTVASPASTPMWNTLLEAARLLSAPTSASPAVSAPESGGAAAGDLSPALASTFLSVRVRCAALSLLHQPEQLHAAAQRVRQHQQEQQSSTAAVVSGSENASSASEMRRALLQPVAADSHWCDFVQVVLESWILRTTPISGVSSPAATEGPLYTLWQDGTAGHSADNRRAQAAITLFTAIADVMMLHVGTEESPSSSLSSSAFVRGSDELCELDAERRALAASAATVLDFCASQLFSATATTTETTTSRQHRELLQRITPSFLHAAVRVAAGTGDAAWLSDQFERALCSPQSSGFWLVPASSSSSSQQDDKRRRASARLDVHLIAMLCFDPALLAATCRVVDRARRRRRSGNDSDDVDSRNAGSNEGGDEREKIERLVRLLRKVGHRGQFAARFRSSYSFDASVRAVMLREGPAAVAAAGAAFAASLHRSDALGALCSGEFAVSRQMRAGALFANGGSDGASAVTAALEATAVEADEHWSRGAVMRRMRAERRGRASGDSDGNDGGGSKPVPVVVASGEFFAPSPSMAHASARQLRNHAAHAALVDTAAIDAQTSTRMPRRAPSRFSARVRLQVTALNAAVEREQRDAAMATKKKPLHQ